MAERNPKGSANVVRRTWDKNKYEQKAKDREEYGDEHVDKPAATDDEGVRDRQEFRAAEPGAAGPAGSKRAWLQPREKTLTDEEIEAVAGKIVSKVTGATGGSLRS